MHGLLHPCDVEFDRLYDKLDRTLKNLSVDDADETGIHDFETDFLIYSLFFLLNNKFAYFLVYKFII